MALQRGFFREVTLRKSLQRSLFTETLFFPIYSNLQNYQESFQVGHFEEVTSERSFWGGHIRESFQGGDFREVFFGSHLGLFREVIFRKSLQRGLVREVILKTSLQRGLFREVTLRKSILRAMFLYLGPWRPMEAAEGRGRPLKPVRAVSHGEQ